MNTDLYCVMGHPVAHSQSPWIHTRFAELTGQDIRYTKREIALDQLARSVQVFVAEGGRG
ncbi:MAG: shikimate dehydrogenase, partial [Rhodoferax sp.]|nr:shikimate dehydrogenase [Rhodoferax sp.]